VPCSRSVSDGHGSYVYQNNGSLTLAQLLLQLSATKKSTPIQSQRASIDKGFRATAIKMDRVARLALPVRDFFSSLETNLAVGPITEWFVT
jgi:hypothetical protein